MSQENSWSPGTALVLRGAGFGNLWWAMPVILVQDSPDLIALYWQAGTKWKDVRRHATALELLTSIKADPADQVWQQTDVLMLAVPGEYHAVWVMWEHGQTVLRCWYVNLETPLLRTPIGFDSMDHELDIVISPDRSSWCWKDVQAFDEMVDAGVFTSQQASAIRAEGERVIRRSQAGEPPFGEEWQKWRPPPGWNIPTLPGNWDIFVEESFRMR
jgi:hypothetical protein